MPIAKHTVTLGLIISLLLITACAGPGGVPSSPVPQASLYQRLGEQPGIDAVVGLSLQKAATDPSLSRYFAGADVPSVQALIVEQICDISGGPCTYSGRAMRAAHAGMRISEAEFNIMVNHMRDAMTELAVAPQEQNELLSLLAPLQSDIVIR